MALPSTLTNIANLALTSIGENLISNIDADTDPARIISSQISETIRQVQLMIHWPELLKKFEPTAITEMYNGTSDTYQYILPTDFLEVVLVTDQSNYEIEDWFIEGKYLVTTEANPKVTYKKFSEDVSEWSGRLSEVVYRKLALDTVLQLTDNMNLMKAAEAQYSQCKAEACSKIQARSRHYTKNRAIFGKNQLRRYTVTRRPKGYRY